MRKIISTIVDVLRCDHHVFNDGRCISGFCRPAFYSQSLPAAGT